MKTIKIKASEEEEFKTKILGRWFLDRVNFLEVALEAVEECLHIGEASEIITRIEEIKRDTIIESRNITEGEHIILIHKKIRECIHAVCPLVY